MRAHLLFEQSGTFKKVFQSHGIDAYDYDILNDFGETDYVIDLFQEIRGGYEGKPSIFDEIDKTDIVMAFFPRVRFEAQSLLLITCTGSEQRKWPIPKQLDYSMKIERERSELYELITKLAHIAITRGLQLIIENPHHATHYLTRYWPIKPKVIDTDRRVRGDYYEKPTQYWFIGIEPKQNILWEPIPCQTSNRTINQTRNQVLRSMIAPEYADRFIREYVLDAEYSDCAICINDTAK